MNDNFSERLATESIRRFERLKLSRAAQWRKTQTYPSLTRPRAKPMPRTKARRSVPWIEVNSTPATTVKRCADIRWHGSGGWRSMTKLCHRNAAYYRSLCWSENAREWLRAARDERRAAWPWWKTLRLSLAWHLGRKPLR